MPYGAKYELHVSKSTVVFIVTVHFSVVFQVQRELSCAQTLLKVEPHQVLVSHSYMPVLWVRGPQITDQIL